ncbi:MAG: hypothetical protein HZB26_24035 [Candidatus Hydrogenedentes bacterium]|nr:hypothetical protein [Candidatus Hydrogenedentota bacterium]
MVDRMKTGAAKKRKERGVAMTETCPHCRYEHPAGEELCSICGYPWKWNLQTGDARRKTGTGRSRRRV